MTFSDMYVKYASDQTDAPKIFHKFLSYFVVSSVVNRNAYIPFGWKKLYPNLYLLIVAGSSAHRKSWSIGIATRMINRIHEGFTIPETSSREAFVSELASEDRSPRGAGLIEIDELKGFMDRVRKKSYMEGFVQDLSSLYDGKALNRRKGVDKPERYQVTDPFLNMVAACSNEWFYRSIQSEDISGGFFARFIWVVYDKKVVNPSPRPKPENQHLYGQLIEKLHRIRDFIGEVNFNPEALTFYEEWYRNFYSVRQGGMWDANYHRAAIIIQKMAVLHAVIRAESEVEGLVGSHLAITLPDIKYVTTLIEDTLLNFSKITIGVNKMDTNNKKVLKYIVERGSATRTTIMNGVREMDARTLTEVLSNLEESAVIEARLVGDKNEYVPNETANTYLNR